MYKRCIIINVRKFVALIINLKINILVMIDVTQQFDVLTFYSRWTRKTLWVLL